MADPVHPNWDGIAFQASTDKRGVVIMPTSAQTQPPYSFLPLAGAMMVHGHLLALVRAVREDDLKSYLAWFLEEMAEDLQTAITGCAPED